ncbi:MAG: phospho-N-acetylmuramoyl-pentapeptide-transferase, partial [Anaerolineales bacterium]|nr:phospho-N-acetylmuramoyl-pentapeptide-transferase [Anaerolineales bacterium]
MNGSATALVLAGVSFILTVIWGGPLIRILRRLEVGDSIRLEAPERHIIKVGTPTMGGVMFILPVLLVTVLLNAVSLIGLSGVGLSVLVPLAAMVMFGGLGSLDDIRKLQRKIGEGMRARNKLLLQIVLATGLAFALRELLHVPDLYLPGASIEFDLGWFYYPVAVFIIVGSANA